MADVEDHPEITFYEYPGGPPITFQGPYFTDEQGMVFMQPSPPRNITFGGSGKSDAISRELALVATRQAYLRYSQQGIDLWHHKIPRSKALLASREYESPFSKPIDFTDTRVRFEHNRELRELRERIRFLEAQLESQSPYLQLYRLGAGGLFVAVISIVIWLLTGTGIPFHPLFAAGVIPASLGVIAMAFLVRTHKQQ